MVRVARTFDDEVIRCIRRWSRKLTASSNHVLDPKDLAGVCGLRAADPNVLERLWQIWFNPDPDRGGLKGLRAYLARLCRNAYTNELQKKFAAKRNDVSTLSLDYEYGDVAQSLAEHEYANHENSADDELGVVTLLDFLTADGDQAFYMRDVEEALNAEEYQIVLDLMADVPLREAAKDSETSKSGLGRKRAEVRSKLTAWLEKQKTTHQLRLVPSRNRVFGLRTTRPDRISPENVTGWNCSLLVQPFYVCDHLYPAGDELGTAHTFVNFDLPGAAPVPDRYGLCQRCRDLYWRKLTERLAVEIARLEHEVAREEAEDAVVRLATSGRRY